MKGPLLALSLMTGLCAWQFPTHATEAESNSVAYIKSAFITNYANLLHAEYEDSLGAARQLKSAIDAFLAKPSADTMQNARKAWVDSRQPYLQSEVGRYYDGPIEAIEGYINSWPIDENYIDYTRADPDAGIINQTKQFPVITREILVAANEKGGEKNISTGFHAMEFLLWGQDFDPNGPGHRPPSDYAAESRNAVRRGEYLRLIAALLIEHLTLLEHEWTPGNSTNYRARLLSLPPDAALANILNGLGNLSGTELSGERLLVPYTTKDQENEHSCFSDTTHLDLVRDEIGIQNIYLGRYARDDGSTIQGPGLKALLEKVDPKLAATLETQMAESVAALKAIPPPFDQAILGRDTDPGRVAIKKALDALQAQTASIAKAATVLGIHLNTK
jgi:putative iron-regulated protein